MLGGGGGVRLDTPFFSGIRPPADPLYYFEISIFGSQTPNAFFGLFFFQSFACGALRELEKSIWTT